MAEVKLEIIRGGIYKTDPTDATPDITCCYVSEKCTCMASDDTSCEGCCKNPMSIGPRAQEIIFGNFLFIDYCNKHIAVCEKCKSEEIVYKIEKGLQFYCETCAQQRLTF